MAPPRSRFGVGDVLPHEFFGGWTLIEQLGHGANGEVWQARSGHGGVEVAVKILTRLRGDGYPRFQREVATLDHMLLTDLNVLPIVAVHLPDEPSRDDPPWYCMPVATPIRDAVAGAAPREIARLVAELARTLVRLDVEHEMHHRDLKPVNLFLWEGKPVLADFGLVLWADVEDGRLTEVGDAAGARNFAPDDLRQGLEPDWVRFDAYCLAKTLWCLVTGRENPPSGRIIAGGFWSLERQANVVEAAINELDAVLDSATAEDPAERSTMDQLARGIAAWLDALEIRDEIVAYDLQIRRNRNTVQRWLVGWAQTADAWFGKAMINLEDAEADSVVPGLTQGELGDALEGLSELGMVVGEPVAGGRGPLAWTKVFPTSAAIDEIENQRALEAQLAPFMRRLFNNPRDVLTLRAGQHGDFGDTGEQAFYRLRYLRDRGYVTFDELLESGPGTTLTNLRLTARGTERIATEV
jgi:Protein kinase domain